MRGSSAAATAREIVNAANTHTPVRREISLASLCAEPSLPQPYFNKFLTNPSGFSCPTAPNLHLVSFFFTSPRSYVRKRAKYVSYIISGVLHPWMRLSFVFLVPLNLRAKPQMLPPQAGA